MTPTPTTPLLNLGKLSAEFRDCSLVTNELHGIEIDLAGMQVHIYIYINNTLNYFCNIQIRNYEIKDEFWYVLYLIQLNFQTLQTFHRDVF